MQPVYTPAPGYSGLFPTGTDLSTLRTLDLTVPPVKSRPRQYRHDARTQETSPGTGSGSDAS